MNSILCFIHEFNQYIENTHILYIYIYIITEIDNEQQRIL